MQRKKFNTKYSPEFKISCIIDMRTNHLSYHEVARKFLGARSVSGELNKLSIIKRWERIYLEEGEAGFYIERCGRTRKMDNPNRGRPRKKPLDKKIKEDLIGENQRLKEENMYLRAELEYLKKLDALVHAEEQKKNKK